MKPNYFIYLLVLMITSIVSCKKEDPKPSNSSQTQTPVFSFSGEINGIPLSVQAGINDFSISSYYTLNQNGVYEFNSSFKNKNCSSNCPNSLKISINDYRPSASGASVIDSIVLVGNHPFAVPSGITSRFIQTFIGGLFHKTGAYYTWNFGDNTPAVKTTIPTITHTYMNSGIYSVTLLVKDSTDICSSSITNTIKLGQMENTLSAAYFPTNIIGDSVLFTSTPSGGTAPYSYLWDFGDGNFSTLTAPIHKYNSSGTYSTKLTITDSKGYTDMQSAYVALQPAPGCASFFHKSTVTEVPDPLNLSGVIIEWTDLNGTVWTSNNDKQSLENSSFKILSVEDYLNNENGDPTKKIQVAFSCKLYNGSTSIDIKNATATIAVAYKK